MAPKRQPDPVRAAAVWWFHAHAALLELAHGARRLRDEARKSAAVGEMFDPAHLDRVAAQAEELATMMCNSLTGLAGVLPDPTGGSLTETKHG